jgi:hypothetical protein
MIYVMLDNPAVAAAAEEDQQAPLPPPPLDPLLAQLRVLSRMLDVPLLMTAVLVYAAFVLHRPL